MRSLALRLSATALAIAVLAPAACVDVQQDPPFRTNPANAFTVAEFNTATGKVPFPITLPCPRAVSTDPATRGACPSGGTFDIDTGRVAVPIVPCQAGQTPCLRAGKPAGCVPCDSAALAAPLRVGLNTLDGFATYAALRTTFDKEVDATTVTQQTAFLLSSATGVADFTPRVVTVDAGEPAQAVTLFLEPKRTTTGNVTASVKPLRPSTDYLAILTTGIKDMSGKPIGPDRSFAFLRSRTPLAESTGKAIPGSLLESVAPADVGCTGTALEQAACLDAFRASTERTRLSFDAIFRALEASPQPIPRENIALLWPVKTQSIASALVGIRAGIIPQGVPAVMTRSDVGGQTLIPGTAVYVPRGIPAQDVKVGTFHLGCVLTPMFLRPPTSTFKAGAGGIPEVAPHSIPYVLAKPSSARPETGYPVVIFGHGIGRWRYDMIAVANALAGAGFATVAIDHVWHGDRSTDVLGQETATPGGCRLTGPMTDPPVRCSDPAGTFNATTMTCDMGTPVVSGSNMFSANFFGVRDNFRQGAIDLMQLVKILEAQTVAGGAPEFDKTKISYVGHSLGSIIGTLFVATEPKVNLAVFNVGAGGLTNFFAETATTAICKPLSDLLALAGICERDDPTKCACKPTSTYLNFVATAQWIIDPADAINYAQNLIEAPLWCVAGTTVAPCSALPAGSTPIAKKVLFQRMENDQVFPTSTQHDLRAAAGPRSCYREFSGGTNHAFLLNPGTTAETLAVTQAGQSQVVSFLASGGATTKLPALGGTASDACPQ